MTESATLNKPDNSPFRKHPMNTDPKHILIVDDEALIAAAEMQNLLEAGYSVSAVYSGERAVSTIKAGEVPVDLILMDIDLGRGMDGTEAAREILRLRDIPILFVSSHTEREVVEKTEAITSYGYVVKNSGEMVLQASIKMAFRLFESHKRERAKEDALAESEQRFRSAFESASVGMFLSGIDGSILQVNSAFCEMLGRAEIELLGFSVEKFTHPADLAMDMEHARELIAGERRTHRGTKRFIHREGHSVWTDLTVSLQRDQHNTPQNYITYLIDTTGSHQAVEQLRSLQDRTSQLIESANDWIWEIDENNLFTFSSGQVYDILGFAPEELIGKPFFDFMPDIEAIRMLSVFSNSTRNRIPFKREEHVNRHKNGRLIILESNGMPVVDDSGTVTGFRGTARDITGSKLAAEEQVATRELLRIVNTATSTTDLIRQTTVFLKMYLGCDALGIRIREGEDYPYYQTTGFARHFVEAERYLCSRGTDGTCRKDSSGAPILECLCGSVLRGRVNPAKPFFTGRGSFWTNSTSRFAGTTTEDDRMGPTRNRCIHEGYESLGLFPMRVGTGVLGLVQVNDKRTGFFTTERIAFLERLADNLGIAFAHRLSEEALKASQQKYSVIADNTYDWEFWQAPDDTFLYHSPSCHRITGYKAEEFLHNPDLLMQIVHPEDREAYREHHRIALKGSGAEAIEFRVFAADGTIRWIGHVSQRVLSPTGEFLGIRGSNRDLTGQKRMEGQVHELSLFAFHNPGPVLSVDSLGIIQACNPAAEHLGIGVGHSLVGYFPDLRSLDIRSIIASNRIVMEEVSIDERIVQFTIRGDSMLSCVHLYGTELTELRHALDRIRTLVREKEIRARVERIAAETIGQL
jgi:PAS domain S-box-containing protein